MARYAFLIVAVLFGCIAGTCEAPLASLPPQFHSHIEAFRCCSNRQSEVTLFVYADNGYDAEFNPEIVTKSVPIDENEWRLTLATCGASFGPGDEKLVVRLTEHESTDAAEARVEEYTVGDLGIIEVCSCRNGIIEDSEQCETDEDCGFGECLSRCECVFEPWSSTFRENCDAPGSKCVSDPIGDYVALPEWNQESTDLLPQSDIVQVGLFRPDAPAASNLIRQIELVRPYFDPGISILPANVSLDDVALVVFVETAAEHGRPATVEGVPDRQVVTTTTRLVIGTNLASPINTIESDTAVVFEVTEADSLPRAFVRGPNGANNVYSAYQDRVLAILVSRESLDLAGLEPEFGVLRVSELRGEQFVRAADVQGSSLQDPFILISSVLD